MSTASGVRYVLRGLRQGRHSTIALGTLIIVSRLVLGRRRGGRPVTVRLRRGDTVGLRVSRPGEHPVTFHVR